MELNGKKIETVILEKTKETGASLAGIARVADLKASPSYAVYDKKPFYSEYKGVTWDETYKSVLVWALYHPASEPIMDWWSMKVPGFTPGNRVLRDQSKNLRVWIETELHMKALSLPYQIEYGGVFLKDSAALAGLGVFGRNNILITSEFGPRVRLRGIFLEAELEPTGPSAFDPCKDCAAPCHRACPQYAFRSGKFERDYCKIENDKRYANEEMLDGSIMGIDEPSMVMKPCRNCELSCPVGRTVVG